MYRVYVFSGMYVASVMVVRFGKIYYTIYIRLEAYIQYIIIVLIELQECVIIEDI
jgi:hypothetical protein